MMLCYLKQIVPMSCDRHTEHDERSSKNNVANKAIQPEN